MTQQQSTLARIQTEVGQWSVRNFQSQRSRHTAQLLGQDAPLMGMMEELGELFEANIDAGPGDAVFDALGDIGIYLCDYACRSGVDLQSIETMVMKKVAQGLLVHVAENPLRTLVTGLGRLAHANLKRHQGIRGFDVNAKFRVEEAGAIGAILLGLYDYTEQCSNSNFITVLEKTFVHVVKPRKWMDNPVAADDSVVDATDLFTD